MGEPATITIDMDKKCAESGKGGAVDNGLCLKCTLKTLGSAPMKSEIGRRVRARLAQKHKTP